jgi:hypothetical protein
VNACGERALPSGTWLELEARDDLRALWGPAHSRTAQPLFVDGGAGLENAIAAVWDSVPVQRCTIWIRAYWPDRAILDGTWKTPVIKVVN